jgi:hypothetical protein
MPAPTRHYSHWTKTEVAALRKMAKQGNSAQAIAKKLKRMIGSVYQKASREGIALRGR